MKYEVEVHTSYKKSMYEYYEVEANSPEEARDLLNNDLSFGKKLYTGITGPKVKLNHVVTEVFKDHDRVL